MDDPLHADDDLVRLTDVLAQRAEQVIASTRTLEARVKRLNQLAGYSLEQLQRLPALIEQQIPDEPGDVVINEAHQVTLNIFLHAGQATDDMRTLLPAMKSNAADHDHLLAPLLDEATTFVAICSSARDVAQAALRRTEQLEALEKGPPLGAFAGIDPRMLADIYDKDWRSELAALRTRHAASAARAAAASRAVAMIAPLAQRLATLDERAQRERGCWLLIDSDLASINHLLGDRSEFNFGSVRFATHSRAVTEYMRQVVERTTNYLQGDRPRDQGDGANTTLT